MNAKGWIRDSSLWLVGLGLMLASSGLDGVYMAKWMPAGWWVLGLVLNTMADIANLILMYWYTRFRQSPKGSKRYKLAAGLLPAEGVAVGFSWFLSWRQLRAVLPAVEPEHWRWVAPIAAGFIPLLLAFIGWAQALVAGKLDEPAAQPAAPAAVGARRAVPVLEPAPFRCPHDGCDRSFGSQQALNAHMRAQSNGSHQELAVVLASGPEYGAGSDQ